MLIGRKEELFKDDISNHEKELKNIVSLSSFLVIGGAGSIGQAVTKEIFKRNYWTCVGVSLVLAALTGGGSSVIGRIGGNNTSVSYHHYGSDYYYGDSARGFMISMVVVAVTLIVILAAVAFTIFAGNVFKLIKGVLPPLTCGSLPSHFSTARYCNTEPLTDI